MKNDDLVIKANEICIICKASYSVTLTHKSYDFCPKCLEIIRKINELNKNKKEN